MEAKIEKSNDKKQFNRIESIVEDFLLKSNEKSIIKYFESSETNTNNLSESNWNQIFDSYPVESVGLKEEKAKSTNFLLYVLKSFKKDIRSLNNIGLISNLTDCIENFEIGVGDFHNGKSTTIVHLNEKNRLVFKPTNGEITKNYHNFLDWINEYYSLGDYKFNIYNRKQYHWLEFISYNKCHSKKEIENYYTRAGYLLCIGYVLNSSDFHYENVISRGDTPVLIDHETVLQPKFFDKHLKYFKKLGDSRDSVLDSLLLLDNEVNVDMARGKCGFGYHKQRHDLTVNEIGVNRFTKNWKMVRKLEKYDLFKHNIPTLKNYRVYPKEYINTIIDGFNECYIFLLNKVSFLRDTVNSPLNKFNDCSIRYVWRQTKVYAKILACLNNSEHISGNDWREQKLRKWLSIAYKKVPKNSTLWLIYEHEVAQMLRGDIPYFEIDSSSRDLKTEFGPVKDFFELSAEENIKRKLNKLSYEDLEHQKKIIVQSVS